MRDSLSRFVKTDEYKTLLHNFNNVLLRADKCFFYKKALQKQNDILDKCKLITILKAIHVRIIFLHNFNNSCLSLKNSVLGSLYR